MAEWSIRVTVLAHPGVPKAQAERAARSIRKHAEALAAVSHAYEVEVYDLDAACEPDDEALASVKAQKDRYEQALAARDRAARESVRGRDEWQRIAEQRGQSLVDLSAELAAARTELASYEAKA